ncbi:MAG: phosphoesterase [Legionellales bacterium]|nr:phosphoesterase [Legionellales bacterium]|tara:strand:+ start:468 stop:719 length:252 start_codon:yes stop_codon:yes gene_type:complete
MAGTNAHWRDSARAPKFFFIDAYAAFPLLIFTLHIRWWTFFLAIITIIFFAILERFGFTLPVFKRFMRAFLAGNHRVARPWWV